MPYCWASSAEAEERRLHDPAHEDGDRLGRRGDPVEDGGHLVGDGHLHPDPGGQGGHRVGGAHALGHHAGAGGDLGQRAAPGQLLPHPPGAALAAAAGGHPGAHPREPAERHRPPAGGDPDAGPPSPVAPPKVSGRPPRATPRRVSSATPRVMRAARVLSPKPMPSEIPAAMATTFLSAPPSSQPTTSGLVYTRNASVLKSCWSRLARSGSVAATTLAVGCP